MCMRSNKSLKNKKPITSGRYRYASPRPRSEGHFLHVSLILNRTRTKKNSFPSPITDLLCLSCFIRKTFSYFLRGYGLIMGLLPSAVVTYGRGSPIGLQERMYFCFLFKPPWKLGPKHEFPIAHLAH